MTGKEKNTHDTNHESGDFITEKLREYYNSVKNEPLPERFLELIDKLEEAEKKASSDQSE